MDYSNVKNVLVVGLGYRTGLAVCNFLAGRGLSVTASDSKSERELASVTAKLDTRVQVVAGEQDPGLLGRGYDLIVLSPGVPASIPLIAGAVKRGIPVISEVELAYYHLAGILVGITGTDGKSTTTALTGHIMSETGFDTLVGGNIGIPLISFAGKTSDHTVTVAELSSYQLETIREFRPRVAALLNVTPDHLDRYRGMDEYLDAKLKVAMNQRKEDFFIANGDDALVLAASRRVQSKVLTFSLTNPDSDIYYDGATIVYRNHAGTINVADPSKMRIPGVHNIQNAMAAILMSLSVCALAGKTPDYERIAAAVYTFPGLEHRMEIVGRFLERTFINDSKATTVGAVEMAVRGFTGNCILILGGRTKGDDYSRLVKGIQGRVKGLVLIGESTESFSKIFSGFKFEKAGSLDDAAARAMRMSAEGDAILLSPACASFDMFENYEERGRKFKESFGKLVSGELAWT